MADVVLAVLAFWFFVAVATLGVSIFRKFVQSDFHDVWSDDD